MPTVTYMFSHNTSTTFNSVHALPSYPSSSVILRRECTLNSPTLLPHSRLIFLSAVSVKVSKSFQRTIYTTAMMMTLGFY